MSLRRGLQPIGRADLNALHAWQKDLATTGWTGIFSTVADIILVAVVVYYLIVISRRTRAWQVIIGLIIFLMLVFLTNLLQLHEFNYLLKSFVPLGPIAIVMLFYPELRHTLENLGRVSAWGRSLAMMPKEDVLSLIAVVVRASTWMSLRKIGALIVIEREGALEDIAATGTRLNADVSENLLCSIFYPGNPLHHGAVIIRGTRVTAAGCTLPLSESAHIGTMATRGTRPRWVWPKKATSP